ncbi:hypothetical protein, partial [Pseudorhizobium flavum]
ASSAQIADEPVDLLLRERFKRFPEKDIVKFRDESRYVISVTASFPKYVAILVEQCGEAGTLDDFERAALVELKIN